MSLQSILGPREAFLTGMAPSHQGSFQLSLLCTHCFLQGIPMWSPPPEPQSKPA